MAERLNTTFSRRTSSKRRITNIANRFEQIKGELNAQQTAQGLRDDMRDALSKFGEINELLWPLPYKNLSMVYHSIPFNTIQYHSLPLRPSMVYWSVSMVP